MSDRCRKPRSATCKKANSSRRQPARLHHRSRLSLHLAERARSALTRSSRPASENCSNRYAATVIEVVVRDQRQDGFAARCRGARRALHVVDLVAHIGFEQRRGPVRRAPGAMSAAVKCRRRILTPSVQRKSRSSTRRPPSRQAGRIGDVEFADVLQLEALRLVSDPNPAGVIAAAARETLGKSERPSPCNGPPAAPSRASKPLLLLHARRFGRQLQIAGRCRTAPSRTGIGRCGGCARTRSAACRAPACPRAA